MSSAIVDAGDSASIDTATLDYADLEKLRGQFPAHLDADRFTILD